MIPYRKLKSPALERSKWTAQLVREGVDKVLGEAERADGWNQLREVVVSCHDPDGGKDVAARHDEHLARAHTQEGRTAG